MKLGRADSKSALDGAADDFNASIRVDARMYTRGHRGLAWRMRACSATCGIVTEAEAESDSARRSGKSAPSWTTARLEIDPDLRGHPHRSSKQTLTARIGDTGKKLHTARSRNDQVAVDTRLYLRRMADEVKEALLRARPHARRDVAEGAHRDHHARLHAPAARAAHHASRTT